MKSFVSKIIIAFFLCIPFAGCGGGGDDHPGEQTQIPADAETITFAGGAGWGDVTFSHATHANEYYDGVCLACHDHEDVGGETHWSCRDCHSAGTDAEGLCEEYANHGCIMTQCQDCHLLEIGQSRSASDGSVREIAELGHPPDGSECGHCHGFPDYAETITFAGGDEWGPVPFTHQQHATTYYGGECLVCHDHDEGDWSCGECHTAGTDEENLCEEYADHGCIMAQCQDCHEREIIEEGRPAPDGSHCTHCHGFPDYAETITFTDGGGWGPVPFTHHQHAMDYYQGECLGCHHQSEIGWSCRECHSAGTDAEGLCEEYANHGCIMTQCQDCHVDPLTPLEPPDGSACGHCHLSPDYPLTIELPGDTGAICGPVNFPHEQHATTEYLGGRCSDCHHYEETSWQCRVCHTLGGDAEASCTDVDPPIPDPDVHHGCIKADCQDCHLLAIGDGRAAPDGTACMDCHQEEGQCGDPCTSCVIGQCHASLDHASQACDTDGCHTAHLNRNVTADPTYYHTSWEPCTNTECHPNHASDYHAAVQTCDAAGCHSFADQAGACAYNHTWGPPCTDCHGSLAHSDDSCNNTECHVTNHYSEPCVTAFCHTSLPVGHKDDSCTNTECHGQDHTGQACNDAPGCHSFANQVGACAYNHTWEPCTNTACHANHASYYHATQACDATGCHTAHLNCNVTADPTTYHLTSWGTCISTDCH